LGQTLLEIFWWYIPRSLFPGKPLTYSIVFGQTYLSHVPFFNNVSVTPSIIGELYLNFSWPGIMIGSLILGVLLKASYVYFIKKERSAVSVMFYAIILVGYMMLVEGPIASQIEDILINMLVAFLLVQGMRITLAGRGIVAKAKYDPKWTVPSVTV